MRVRTGGGGRCPFCAGKRVSVTNSLAARAPEVAREWHPTRNGSLRASDVTFGSARKVWWKCRRDPDHDWLAEIAGRAGSRPSHCPFCSGHRVSATNSLAARRPDLAREWHPTRNGELRPSDVTAGTPRRVWWKCLEGADHEWQARVFNRLASKRCPFCAGKRISVSNSLASRAPVIAAYWHPTLNGRLSPRDVHVRSSRRVAWLCPQCAYAWWAPAMARMRARYGCPECRRPLEITA